MHACIGEIELCYVNFAFEYNFSNIFLLVSENLSKNMFEYAKRIPKESIVEIKGKVTIPDKPIQGCSQHAEV